MLGVVYWSMDTYIHVNTHTHIYIYSHTHTQKNKSSQRTAEDGEAHLGDDGGLAELGHLDHAVPHHPQRQGGGHAELVALYFFVGF